MAVGMALARGGRTRWAGQIPGSDSLPPRQDSHFIWSLLK
jgi:hypothetical protein